MAKATTVAPEERTFDPVAMDAAAKDAMAEFVKVFTPADQKKVAVWWNRHYTKAGHKRLGRALAKIAKEALKKVS